MFKSFLTVGMVALVCVSVAEAVGQDLILRVRVIRAQGMLDEAADRSKVKIDRNLEDLENKLKTLPYEKFSLVKDLTREVSVKEKVQFDLCKKQVLHARTLYREGNRVGIWLRWNDKEGEPLLDTRLHLDIDQSMLVGSDEDVVHNGKVLAISLEQPAAP